MHGCGGRNNEKKSLHRHISSYYTNFVVTSPLISTTTHDIVKGDHRKGIRDTIFQVSTAKRGKRPTARRTSRFLGLCDVEKKVPVFVVSSKILLFHQTVNSLLDARDFGNEVPSHGLNCFEFYLLVRKLFSCLHHSHNRRIEVMLPVALNRTLRALRFFGLQAAREGGDECSKKDI
jgi:hypothetical protein